MSRRVLVLTAIGALMTVHVVVSRTGDSIEQRAHRFGALLAERMPRTIAAPAAAMVESSVPFAETRRAADPPSVDVPDAVATGKCRRPRHQKAERPAPPHDIRVPATTVLRWVRAGIRPVGVSVSATKARPAGIRLSGVAPLGISVRDGDVLTHVEGRPVQSVGDVIATVLAALGRKQTTLGGRLYRDDRSYAITVEIPTADPGRPAVARIVASNAR